MAGYNKVIIMGNLCADPELRFTPSGTPVTELRLAVTTKKKSGDDTVFVDVTVWERQAETCCEYLAKGKPVLVEGRLKMDEWNDRESGKKRTKIGVVAQSVQFLGGKDDSAPRQEHPPQSAAQAQLDKPLDNPNDLQGDEPF